MARYRGLSIIGFLYGIGQGVMWSIYPPYLKLLGYSATLYGLIGGSGVIVSAIASLVAGIAADEGDARRPVVYGLITSLPVYPLVALGTLWSLFTAALLSGVSSGLYYTGFTVMVSREASDSELHYAYSIVNAYSLLGSALGLFMGWIPILLHCFNYASLLEGYRYMFLIPIPLIVLAFIPLGRIKYMYPKRGRAGISIRSILSGYVELPRKLWILLLSNAIIGFGAAMSIHNIGYYFALKYNVTSGELGSMFGVQVLIMALMMLHLPRLVEKVDRIVDTYLLVTSPSIPLIIALTMTNNYLVASVIYIVRSILMNLANPLFNALTMKLTPVHLRGRASSILGLPWTLLGGIGRSVGGRLMDIDIELPLRISAILYTIGLSIIALYLRDAED